MSDKVVEKEDIFHETEIFCNPVIHNFTGERRNLDDPW
jgi:hypothetical protein